MKNVFLILFCLLIGCIESYQIPDISYQDILVVDGFISGSSENQTVKLSRTSPNNRLAMIPEAGAEVWIESDKGKIIDLIETQSGNYQTDLISGIAGTGYKLFINTKNGRRYSSESVKLKEAPDIDSIYGRYLKGVEGATGVQIYLDVKAGSDQSRHFRWKYFETYEIHTPRQSLFEWLGGNTVADRTIPVDVCWRTDTLKNILVTSTQGFSENSVIGFPIKFISTQSFQLQVKYRLFVKQYSLSEQGYSFWNFLKTISERQGSLFDIQPGRLPGNITCLTDSSEPVLGYFDASEVSNREIYFTPDEFRAEGFRSARYQASCDNLTPDVVPIDQIGTYFNLNGTENRIISDATGLAPNVFLIMYPRICCDCTILGTNNKPSFWK